MAKRGHAAGPERTGQTVCSDTAGSVIACAGTGQDGELRAGEVRSYVDNGDGTIRDKRAGLTWEKLSDDDTIHDQDALYTWDEAFAKVDALNTAAFAGVTDWRLPNRFELSTLLNLGTFSPAISAPFTTCTAGCAVLTCSCTKSTGYYWSSTSGANLLTSAWIVDFWFGGTTELDKTTARSVRAVRGGS